MTTDHRNVVRENFFRDIGGVTLVRNLFRPIRIINRTNSRTIWTPTYEDIDHNGKKTSFPPPKKNPHQHISVHLLFVFHTYIFCFHDTTISGLYFIEKRYTISLTFAFMGIYLLDLGRSLHPEEVYTLLFHTATFFSRNS